VARGEFLREVDINPRSSSAGDTLEVCSLIGKGGGGAEAFARSYWGNKSQKEWTSQAKRHAKELRKKIKKGDSNGKGAGEIRSGRSHPKETKMSGGLRKKNTNRNTS